MRRANALSAAALKYGGEHIEAGMTTWELDKLIYDFIVKHGGIPNFKGLYGFPGTACISLNDTIIHGIPSLLMSKAILKCQREDGYWNVSLVCPANYGGPEMTGTGLFLYGMAWGVQQGILPRATYQKAMDKAWKALAASVHEDGFIGYNQGTGKDPAAGQPVTFTSVPDFEDYGTGCLLLGAAEYYKLLKAKK